MTKMWTSLRLGVYASEVLMFSPRPKRGAIHSRTMGSSPLRHKQGVPSSPTTAATSPACTKRQFGTGQLAAEPGDTPSYPAGAHSTQVVSGTMCPHQGFQEGLERYPSELVGGDLMRSLGGWGAVQTAR